MADDSVVTTVRSASIGRPGRSLSSARAHHFVLDSSTKPEALSNTESFLAGISSCGVTLIENYAAGNGVPLTGLVATISGVQDRADPAQFRRIEVRFELRGVGRAEAERLVEVWRSR
ncbi:MAG TPA: OsmC family protein [bacterium]|nr:OsmC family protein [bacterium]